MVGTSLGPLPPSMGRSHSRVIVEVVAPVALLPGIALSPGNIVRYGRLVEKVVTSFRSSLPRTSRVFTLVSRVSFPSLGNSYLHSPWRQPHAPHPSSRPPRGGTSFGRVVVLHCLGDSDWTWPGVMREGLLLVVPWFRRLFPPPCLYCILVSVTGFLIVSFVFAWNTAKVFLLLPAPLFDLFLYLRFG